MTAADVQISAKEMNTIQIWDLNFPMNVLNSFWFLAVI